MHLISCFHGAGRRALVVLPNDPDLVDILAKNGVDISVSEGEQQGNYVSLLGNLLFPLLAFGGLFFLFRGAGGQGGAGGGLVRTLFSLFSKYLIYKKYHVLSTFNHKCLSTSVCVAVSSKVFVWFRKFALIA